MSGSNVQLNPTNIAGNTLVTMRRAQGTTAANISQSPVPGAKASTVVFSTSAAGGGQISDVVLENSAQGTITTSSSHSIAISGQGGIPVLLSDGTVGASRNGFSQGLDKDNRFVLGSSSNPNAPVVLGFNTDELGNPVRADGTGTLDNLNDLAQLVPIDLSNYLTYSRASTRLTLNTVLNNSQTSNATTDPPMQNHDVQQNATFYDSVGGSHNLTITWRKVLAPSDPGANNDPAPSATSTRYVDADGVTHDNCDVWKAIIEYDDGNYAHYGGTTTPLDPTDAPRIYIRNGVVVGFAQPGTNEPLGTGDAFPSIRIPFEANGETYGDVVLDSGLSTLPGSRSTVIAQATNFKSSGSINGSKFVEMIRWTVDEAGGVQITYSGGANRTAFKIPIATFPSVDNVFVDSGIWIATNASGAMNMNFAGTGSAGSINTGKVEESTIDSTREMLSFLPLSETITAASKIISATMESQKEILRAFG